MSMSTNVIGFRPPDVAWEKMKAVWDACAIANVEPPPEVQQFFGGEEPDELGVEVDISKAKCEWHGNSANGVEVDLSLLPKDLRILRFYNSW